MCRRIGICQERSKETRRPEFAPPHPKQEPALSRREVNSHLDDCNRLLSDKLYGMVEASYKFSTAEESSRAAVKAKLAEEIMAKLAGPFRQMCDTVRRQPQLELPAHYFMVDVVRVTVREGGRERAGGRSTHGGKARGSKRGNSTQTESRRGGR